MSESRSYRDDISVTSVDLISPPSIPHSAWSLPSNVSIGGIPHSPHFLCPNATSTTPTMMIAIAMTPIIVIRSPANAMPRVTAITGFT